MTLTDEWVLWANGYTGNRTYTATWTIDFPPATVLAKVSPYFFMQYDPFNVSMLGTHILSIRRRLPSGADTTLYFSDTPAIYYSQMTSVTYSLYLFNCQARILLDLGFWK